MRFIKKNKINKISVKLKLAIYVKMMLNLFLKPPSIIHKKMKKKTIKIFVKATENQISNKQANKSKDEFLVLKKYSYKQFE